jgi:hypothetical protein
VSVAEGARKFSRTPTDLGIIEFVQSPRGFAQNLFPAQRFFLKVFEREDLDDTVANIPIMDKFNENILSWVSEEGYYNRLLETGRISMSYDVYRATDTMQLSLCMGRRASKTTLITSYAGFKLYQMLNMDFPQIYFGIIPTDPIKITMTALGGDNAVSLFKRLSSLIRRSPYFQPYFLEDPTSQQLKLWTRHDLEGITPGKTPPTGTNSFTIAAVANSPGVRGDNNVVVIFDEYAHIERSKVARSDEKALDAEMYDALVPSISGFRNPTEEQAKERGVKLIKGERYGAPFGKALFLSSPNGPYGKFYEDIQLAYKIGPQSYTLAIQAPTWEVNNSVAPEYLHQKYNQSPVSYDQEFGGLFISSGMNWIRNMPMYYSSVDVRLDHLQHFGRSDRQYFLGVDFALSHDGTGVTISHFEPYYNEDFESFSKEGVAYWKDFRFDIDPEFYLKEGGHPIDWYHLDNPEYLISLHRPKGRYIVDYTEVRYAGKPPYESYSVLSIDLVLDWIQNLYQRWPIRHGIYDQWSGQVIAQLVEKRGFQNRFEMINFNTNSNDAMYKLFSSLLHEGSLKIPDDPNLHEELLSLKVEDKGRGLIKVESPSNRHHDDRFDSLVRSLYLCHSYKNKNLVLAGENLKNLFNNVDIIDGGPNLGNIRDASYRAKAQSALHLGDQNIRSPNYNKFITKAMMRGRG